MRLFFFGIQGFIVFKRLKLLIKILKNSLVAITLTVYNEGERKFNREVLILG
jgi:hypothetical protein